MKKLLAAAAMFALVGGFVVGAILITPQQSDATVCVYTEEPFIWQTGTCHPEPGTKYVGQVVWVKQFVCLGYWANTTDPCMCTYLGCVIDRTHQPPDPVIP